MDEFWVRVAARHGIVTTAEAIARFGRHGFYRRVADGQFDRLHHGVWRVAGSPTTSRQRIVGFATAVGGYASVRTVLALNGVPGQTYTRPEVTRVGRAGLPIGLKHDLGEGVRPIVHWTNFLPKHHVTEFDSIPSTTVARALCDCSAVMSLERLGKVVDNCKRMGLITYDELAECREDIRARGRRRTTYLDEILAERIAGWVVGESPPEDVVRKWLEDDGFEPVAQHWVTANGRRRRIDVALPNDRIAVEYQGLDSHATATAVINDSEKITDLQLAGWLVVLVTKKTTRLEFIRNVRAAIDRRRR